MSKKELRPPPPPRAKLRAGEPWELCSIASAKKAPIAAAVRRWWGYCHPSSSWAAATRARSGATCATLTAWPLSSSAVRRPMATADICAAAA